MTKQQKFEFDKRSITLRNVKTNYNFSHITRNFSLNYSGRQ